MGLSSTLVQSTHTTCPPGTHTHAQTAPNPLSLALAGTPPLTHGRQTCAKVQSQTITLSINKNKKPNAHTDTNTCMCMCGRRMNWLKSVGGFSFACYLPLPDRKFSILSKTCGGKTEIDLCQDAVGNVNKEKLRTAHIEEILVSAFCSANFVRSYLCACMCACVRRAGLTFCPLSTLSKLST